MRPAGSPGEVYSSRRDRFVAEAALWGRRSLRLAVARGAAFAALLLCLLLILLHARSPGAGAVTGAVAALAAYIALAAVHARVLAAERKCRELVSINEEGLARLERAWDRLPAAAPPEEPSAAAADLARDLGLFGRASLFQLLGTAHTPPGRLALGRLLLLAAASGSRVMGGADPEGVIRVTAESEESPRASAGGLGNEGTGGMPLGTGGMPLGTGAMPLGPVGPGEPADDDGSGLIAGALARQSAVAELAPEIAHRQRLELHARPLGASPPDCEPFLRWAEGGPWLRARPALLWGLRGLTLATVVAVAAALLTPLPAGAAAWLLITVNISVSYAMRERLSESLNQVSAREGEFRLYSRVLEAALEGPASSPCLAALAARLAPSGLPVPAAMARLQRRINIAEARHSAILHLLLQSLLLWDFHALDLLERWQHDFGRHARIWLSTLGEIEALAALAALRFENPGWCFPTFGRDGSPAAQGVIAGKTAGDRGAGTAGDRRGEEEAVLSARQLGHPLLAATRRVANDIKLGPPGTFLLVTGSNMSGKSTLLRAIGLNAVLAHAGGPVCAEALRLPPLALATSILVEDSLADGVSFFMAELLRVRRIVDAADRCRSGERVLLYLLDEVLRGTNSRERRLAVRRVLGHLLSAGAIGAISTHDLELAEVEELSSACIPVHFRETLHAAREVYGAGDPGQGPERPAKMMTFDYLLRPGVATSFNALALLELVGLGDPR